LTPYAITARYPGIEKKVTKKEAIRALNIAEKVRRTVQDVLKQLGLDLP
jgi:HEPN domain-containing protein